MAFASFADADLYGVLGVAPDVDFSAIRSAYRQAALITHPDKGGSADAFLSVMNAFETLSVESSRAAYDRKRNKLRNFVTSCAPSVVERDVAPTQDTASTPTTTAGKASVGVHQGKKRKGPWQTDDEPKEQSHVTGNVATEALRSALLALRILLQRLDVLERREALNTMDSTVKVALLTYMSAAKRPEPHRVESQELVCLPSLEESCSDDSYSCSSSSDTEEEHVAFALTDAPCERECPTQSSCSGVDTSSSQMPEPDTSHRMPRGIHRMNTTYRCSMMTHAVQFYIDSCELETSVEHFILLVQMKRQVIERTPCSTLEQAFAKAFHTTFSDEVKARVRMYLRIAMPAYLGRVEIRTPVLPIEEVLEWRLRAFEGRKGGWPSFREVWADMLASNVCKGGLGRLPPNGFQSRDEADAYVDSLWNDEAQQAYESWQAYHDRRSRPQITKEERFMRREARIRRRNQRHIERAVRRVRRRLFVVEREKKRARQQADIASRILERRAAARRKQLRDARWEWYKRKDLTVPDLLKGPPFDRI
eukprot:TRINITY_DN62564_c0_g1_i1.p1 TRINITY_DN62564_c0_g1~~TRINITY_DN62564_c0_g1_i1.p1  ORF type:complete len:536 (+),score=64.98 TRINITY_DN62564_c0_g1_i1:59-1666(+)